jgi:hypothetical protein
MKTPEDSPQAQAELAEFLRLADQPEGTLTYRELEGFLFAIATAPRAVMPSEWIPPVFGAQGAPSAENAAEAEWVFQRLMGIYNRINGEVVEGRVGLPADLEVAAEPVANVGPHTALASGRPDSLWVRISWRRCGMPRSRTRRKGARSSCICPRVG